MFPDLKDPLDVTRLEIVQFDDASQQCKKPFEVAQVMGRDGKIRLGHPLALRLPGRRQGPPGRSGKPADGHQEREHGPRNGRERAGPRRRRTFAACTTSTASSIPTRTTVKSTDTGVGTRITLKNKEGKTLASLIVGKQVGDQASQHYVRYPDKDAVYVVDIDPSKVSTKFEDWIERNLLGMNTMDLKQVNIQDYAIVPAEDGLHGFEKHEGEYLWTTISTPRRPGS